MMRLDILVHNVALPDSVRQAQGRLHSPLRISERGDADRSINKPLRFWAPLWGLREWRCPTVDN